MQLNDLTDRDLLHLHDHVAEVVENGDPLDDEVRRYGIRDLSSLKLWVHRMERLLKDRGVPYRTISWPASE